MSEPSAAPETLPAALRRLRAERGLTQRDMAALLGYSVSLVRKLERGERAPTSEFVTRLSVALSVPEQEMLRLASASGAAEKPASPALLPPAEAGSHSPIPPAIQLRPAAPALASTGSANRSPRDPAEGAWAVRRAGLALPARWLPIALLLCALLLLTTAALPAVTPPATPPDALRLALAAREALDPHGSGELAALLALRSLQLGYSADADATLAAALDRPLLQQVIRAHQQEVGGVAFSPDGQTLLTGSWDGTARLWAVRTGESRGALLGHADDVEGVAFAPDGRSAITGSDDGTARVWDLASQTTRLVLRGHTGTVYGAVFAPDGRSALTGGSDATVRLWDTQSGAELRRFTGHTDVVVEVSFAPDGTRAVSASLDGTARVWDLASRRELVRLVGHLDGVIGARFTPDGTGIVTTSRDSTVRLWDAASGAQRLRMVGHRGWAMLVAIAPDGQRAFSSGGDGTVREWDLRTGAELERFGGHAGGVLGVAVSPDGTTLASGDSQGAVRLWTIAPPNAANTLDAPRVIGVLTLANGNALLRDDQARIIRWDASRITPFPGRWPFIAASGAGLVTGEYDGTVTLRRLDGTPHLTFNAAHAPARLDALVAAEDLIVTASGGQLDSWDAASGRHIRGFETPGGIAALQIAADGSVVAAITTDGVTVYRLADGQVLARFPERQIALAPNGALAALSGRGGARLVDLADSTELRQLGDPSAAVSQALFTPDGSALLVAGADGAWLYDAQRGAPLRHFGADHAPLRAVSFSTDGRWLLGSADDGTVRRWPVALADSIAAACRVLPRDLTATERARLGLDARPTCG